MGKRERSGKSAKFQFDEEEEKDSRLQSKPVYSSDDDEANEDLSLKIVEKARLRQCTSGQPNGAGDPGTSNIEADIVEDVEIKRKIKKLKKKKPKMDSHEELVVVAKEDKETNASEEKAVENLSETSAVETSDNIVLRKLLRGPRYFDPPDSSWGACYNCGEEGHTTAKCTSARRRKPCFVCGSLEHNAKQCTKGRECFICKKGGHRAKDCPEKFKVGSQGIRMCLKCGNSGHDMFSCTDAYSRDDLEGIQCYICMKFGHLCCADIADSDLGEPSCYRCGQLGHIGSDCSRPNGEASTGSHTACYKCGEEGHFARECASSTKVRKKNLESAPTRKISSRKLDNSSARSVPSDISKARKRKKSQYEGEYSKPSNSKRRGGWVTEDPQDLHYVDSRQYEQGFSTPPNSKKRGGWITEDPQYFPHRDARLHGQRQRSPVTPSNARNRHYTSTPPGHFASHDSYRNSHTHHFGNSASNGASRFQQQRYHQSPMYGNFSNNGTRRNYEW